ncbi:MAG: glycosyltransferase family 2 protein [Patescibacteria group bacterium]|nr:glycosyltransferase family 2 protein [Patescibacteria group bacterium]
MQKLAVITVVYNNYDVLTDFFQSFGAQTDTAFRLWIVDTSTQPRTIAIPEYSTLLKIDNRGYAGGVNAGIAAARKAGYTQFCVINSDVTVASNFIATAKEVLTRNSGSLTGGKIYYAPGYEFHDGYSPEEKGKVLWYAGGVIDWDHVHVSHIGVDQVDHGQFDTAGVTGFITGCLMLYDISVFNRIGDWDESYFLYYEDTDYCMRATRKGIPLRYEPSLVIWHKNAQSTGGSGSKLHTSYQERNRVRFALKYAPLKTKFHVVKNAILRAIGLSR